MGQTMDAKDVTPQQAGSTATPADASSDFKAPPPEALPTSKEALLSDSQKLESLVPDDYHAWKMQADLLLKAIHQLETRVIEADESVTVMGVPLRESALREAAEEALRNCAHFAETFDERIKLVDEANRVRRTTWF
jgi:hypothetical protein